MPRSLTARQRDVFDAIVRWQVDNDRPPTLRELCTALGAVSTNGMREHIDALVAKGYVERTPRLSRGLRIIAETSASR